MLLIQAVDVKLMSVRIRLNSYYILVLKTSLHSYTSAKTIVDGLRDFDLVIKAWVYLGRR